MKYRRFESLYNPVVNTEVFNKLVKYKDNIKLLPDYSYAIKKVIVTYPEDFFQGKKIVKRKGDNFIFVSTFT